jgi:gamma-glutamylcyclotransferase (GGCT)/AIG2-like uncharacterized protein YtfP
MALRSLFVYGTLMLDDVVEALTGKTFRGQSARLDGFARYRVRGQVFPGILPEERGSTTGVLFTEVDDEAMAVFDWFEGDQYCRTTVDVTTDNGKVTAEVYVIADDHRGELLLEPWDYDQFLSLHAKDYVARVKNIS